MPVQTFYRRYQFAPDELLEQTLFAAFTCRQYAPNALVAGPHQPTDRLYFVEKGAIQGFYIDHEGEEITFAFAAESEIIMAPQGLFAGLSRSPDHLRALEPLRVYELAFSDVRTLQQKFHAFALLCLQLTEESIQRHEERARMLHNPDPAYRYQWFLQRHKTLAGRLQVQKVASYLGVSRYTLSRIRSQMAKEGR